MFYHLNDPSGRSLTLTDAEGDTAWQVVYDGYGAVLTGTMPVTLTHTLLDMPDGTTGLVYQGNGRYYDPALGRPLQPNLGGAPPTVPQALNRYAAAPLGQPGVLQVSSASGIIDLRDILVDLGAQETGTWAQLQTKLETRSALLVASTGNLPRYAKRLNSGGGVRAFGGILEGGVSELNQFVHGNELITFPLHDDLRNRVSSRYISHLHRDLAEGSLSIQSASDWYQQSTRQFTPLVCGVLTCNRRWVKAFTGAEILSDGGFGFIFDAGWQFAQDLDNPYIPFAQKLGRATVSGIVGLGSGVVVALAIGTGPIGFVAGVIVGWTIETWATESVIFPALDWLPKRDLAPLQLP